MALKIKNICEIGCASTITFGFFGIGIELYKCVFIPPPPPPQPKK